jgi:hypothetical protein
MVETGPVRFFRSFPRSVLVLAGLAACSSPDSAVLEVTPGGETTTFTQSPAVTNLLIQMATSSSTTTLGYAPVSATTISLSGQSEATTASFEATGLDAQDAAVVFGATLPFQLGAVVGNTIPIFVGRIGQFARAPYPPMVFSADGGSAFDSRQAPVLSMVQGQYLFIAGGSSPDGGGVTEGDAGLVFTPTATTEIYDFGQFAAVGSPPTLPSLDAGALFAPQSVAVTGTVAWLIGAQGGMYFDLSSDAYDQIPQPPAGAFPGSFADIAGGATVTDDEGTQYIVGATRTTGPPTSVVLEINPNDTTNTNYLDGNVAWLALSEPRLGASATWVPGRGLVITGGSASGNGVEILNPMTGTSTGLTTAGAPVPYPADPSVGSGAAPLDGQHVLLAGGVLPSGQDAGVRVIDLACTTACAPTWWTSLPIALGTAQTFGFSTTSALVIGNEPLTGLTHAFVLTGPGSATSVTDASASPAQAAATQSEASVAVSDAAASDAASTQNDAAGPGTDAASLAGDAAVDDDASGPGSAVEILLPTYQDADASPPGQLRNARAIWTPLGSIVVFGGYGVLDSFQPAP